MIKARAQFKGRLNHDVTLTLVIYALIYFCIGVEKSFSSAFFSRYLESINAVGLHRDL